MGGGCSSIARGIPGTECLDHRGEKLLGCGTKRQEVAEQGKESSQERKQAVGGMRIPREKVRKCEHSLGNYGEVESFSFPPVDIESPAKVS